MHIVGFLGQFGYWGIAIGMALESACIPIPSEIILPFGGFLAAQGKVTLGSVIVASQIGGLLGSMLAYGVGRYGGRAVLEKYGKYILISKHDLDTAEQWFARRGEVTIFVGRLLPGIRTFISLPAGIAEMPFGRFLWYSFLGMLPWSALFAWLGLKLGNNWNLVRLYLHRFDYPVIALILLAIGWFIWHKVRSAREA